MLFDDTTRKYTYKCKTMKFIACFYIFVSNLLWCVIFVLILCDMTIWNYCFIVFSSLKEFCNKTTEMKTSLESLELIDRLERSKKATIFGIIPFPRPT